MFRSAANIALLAVLFYMAFYAYRKLGLNYHYKKHYPGDCRHVSGLALGSEDMEVTQDGLAFVTSGVDFAPTSAQYQDYIATNNIQGRVFLFDFKKPSLGARPLKIRVSKTFDPETFQPHGVSMLEDKVKGRHLLYVVNHVKGDNDRIEKFRFVPEANELEHVRFFNDSAFLIINDIALTGEDQFYASNFLYFRSHFASVFEHLLPLPLGGLLHVDAKGAREVVKGLHGPNGITLSKDKKHLYVALPIGHTMHVYERQSDNGLKLVQNIPEVHTGIDNFQLTHAGDALLVGAHPVPYKIMRHLRDPKFKAPSSVLRLPLSNGRVDFEKITELFYDHGDLISASSVAQIHSDQLLIGSVLDKLVVCDLYTRPATKGGKTGKK